MTRRADRLDDSGHHAFAQAWARASQADGWLSESQGLALFHAAEVVPPGQWIVEIGSHCGRSTVLLAAAKRATVPLLAVDPFDDPRWGGGAEVLTKFESTLRGAGLLEDVQTFRGTSADAAAAEIVGPVGLLFVDGAHDRTSVLTDIDGWTPYLAPRAVMLFHDAYSSPGVTAALFERFLLSGCAQYRGSIASLARIEHDALSATPHFVSRVRMVLRLPWFIRNIMVKVALRRKWRAVHWGLGHPGTHYPY